MRSFAARLDPPIVTALLGTARARIRECGRSHASDRDDRNDTRLKHGVNRAVQQGSAGGQSGNTELRLATSIFTTFLPASVVVYRTR
jgi:hypothetical protein